MKNHKTITSALVAVITSMHLLSAQAASPIPLNLPRPDGQPGNSKKPVKVYIMAGQSNTVGFGGVAGAQLPRNVFLMADPAIIPGTYDLARPDDLSTLDSVRVNKLGMHDVKVEKNAMTAQIEVPVTGTYQVHAGFGDSSANVVTLDGKEVYRKEVSGKAALTKVALEQGKRYPVRISFFKDASKVFWLEQVDMVGKGDLVGVTKNDKKFTYLIDDKGEWTVRNDVTYTDPRLFPERAPSPLSPTSNNGKTFGPELGFGSVMGTFHDEPVLLIKSSIGNRSLNWDFRPPSSGMTANPPSEFEGFEYRAILQSVRDTLTKIDKVVPGYQGQGYEIAGFGWFQGHKDSGSTKEDYEKNLVNLIKDLRKDLNAPKMPVVVATVAFHGYQLETLPWWGVWQAQMAVGDPKQHAEFSGNVASVDTRDFWRETEESPKGQDYHYNWNAETYMLVGESMGRAMVRLHGGEAEAFPKSDREARAAAELAKPKPTPEQLSANAAALKPCIIDGALVSFTQNPKNQALLQTALSGKMAAKDVLNLDDAMNLVSAYYHEAGISDYDWKPVGTGTKTAKWDYFGFDLPGSEHKAKPKAASADEDSEAAPAPKDVKAAPATPPQIALPAGIENWFAPEFDAQKAGWKSGVGPFGELVPKDIEESVVLWQKKRNRERPAPATVTDKDVLLLRQTFELPARKEGFRYRIRIEGSPHNNMGEGFAIYINGKLLAETRDGLSAWHRQVFKTRGAFVTPEISEEFKGGKVTIAVANYPLWGADAGKYIAPGPGLSVSLEEQKIPPVGQ